MNNELPIAFSEELTESSYIARLIASHKDTLNPSINPYTAESYTRFNTIPEGRTAKYIIVETTDGHPLGCFDLTESDLNDPTQAANDIIFEIENPK